jgi:hypothetical protein
MHYRPWQTYTTTVDVDRGRVYIGWKKVKNAANVWDHVKNAGCRFHHSGHWPVDKGMGLAILSHCLVIK